ncbi:uncharacterized protein Bfra_001378, partial [Botrytis fragariae]
KGRRPSEKSEPTFLNLLCATSYLLNLLLNSTPASFLQPQTPNPIILRHKVNRPSQDQPQSHDYSEPKWISSHSSKFDVALRMPRQLSLPQEPRPVLSYTAIDGPSFCLAILIKEVIPIANKTHATIAKTMMLDML